MNPFYCCVKDCPNTTYSNKKKQQATFHLFPSNPELCQKWLQAVGQPDLEPSGNTRICSAHFSDDMIIHGNRVRIKKDAFPVYGLPGNSENGEKSLKVCRICLATDVKMFSLHDVSLSYSLEAVFDLYDNHDIVNYPQFVCFECGVGLLRCNRLYEKSKTAQGALLEIFGNNDRLTEYLIKKTNRQILRLQSTLGTPDFFPIKQYEYNDEDGISYPVTDNPVLKTEKIDKIDEIKTVFGNSMCESDDANKNAENKDVLQNQLGLDDMKYSNDYYIDDFVDSLDFIENFDDSNSDSMSFEKPKKKSKRKVIKKRSNTTNLKSKKQKSQDDDKRNEEEWEKEFKIVELTFQEQIEEFKKEVEKTQSLNTNVLQCDVCQKKFERIKSVNLHVARHDPLIHGPWECSICKYRYKNKRALNGHMFQRHSKRYHCKKCPNVLQTSSGARKHLGVHLGVQYACPECAYSSSCGSALAQHRRRRHAHRAHCALCGKGFVTEPGLKLHLRLSHPLSRQAPKPEEVFKCDECDVSFYSEEARRAHFYTSKFHKTKRVKEESVVLSIPRIQDPELKKSCKHCGEKFETVDARRLHARSVHGVRDKGLKSYPTKCQLCDTEVSSRADHYKHVRTTHPAIRDSWTVKTHVCPTCGAKFPDYSRLRIHELRHQSPKVKCPQCPSLFYDKYRLSQHVLTHAAVRPHVCAVCGLGFKARGNWVRHKRVHSDERPYSCTSCTKTFKNGVSLTLHVRTVHQNLPHPPRAKRVRKKKDQKSSPNRHIIKRSVKVNNPSDDSLTD